MRYLLDTHTFIWLDSESAKLSGPAQSIIIEPDNTLFLSLASVWEMQIKVQLDKLSLRLPLADIVAGQEQENAIHILPITLSHILELSKLPDHHKDPFDRMLISQAFVEDIPVITADPQIARYSVPVIW